MKADITLRVGKPEDFKIKLKDQEGYQLRSNFTFFLYNQHDQTMNGPYILTKEMDLKLFNEYLENRIVWVCESHQNALPENWHPKDITLDEQENRIAC